MSPAQKARAKIGSARTVVIKIGSRALVNKSGLLDRAIFKEVAAGAAWLRHAGKQVVMVSSGAILAGRSRLKLLGKTLDMPAKQACAAVGQNDLMSAWARAFLSYGLVVGQVLITEEDLADRARFLNSRNTILELLKLGVVPVINENDTVAVEEIRYGDNDFISTLVVGLSGAQALLILTDIDGLCAEDPAKNPDAPVLRVVRETDASLFACAGPSHSGVGSGGMSTKIEAARTVARMGVPTVIANAKKKEVIQKIMSGAEEGTLFVPEGATMKGRQYWMAFAGGPKGSLVVDEGAAKALVERGKSLLPSGIVGAAGRFKKGDLVTVTDVGGRELAKGLSQYSSEDVKKIMGHKSAEIESILGQKLYDEVIHRDYLVLTSK